ncbi:hypothetical protein U9M48_018334, partial [Paspalum notatum var. saurae]
RPGLGPLNRPGCRAPAHGLHPTDRTVGSAPWPADAPSKPSRPSLFLLSFLSRRRRLRWLPPRSSIPPPPPHTQLAASPLLVVPAPAATSFTRRPDLLAPHRGSRRPPPPPLLGPIAAGRQPAATPPPPPEPPPPLPPFTLAAARSAAAGRRATSLPLASTRHGDLVLWDDNYDRVDMQWDDICDRVDMCCTCNIFSMYFAFIGPDLHVFLFIILGRTADRMGICIVSYHLVVESISYICRWRVKNLVRRKQGDGYVEDRFLLQELGVL